MSNQTTGVILGMGSANDRQGYIVALTLIGWTHSYPEWFLNHQSIKKLYEVEGLLSVQYANKNARTGPELDQY